MQCDEANYDWEETVDMLNQHAERCEVALVPCPNKCREKREDGNGTEIVMVMRKELQAPL